MLGHFGALLVAVWFRINKMGERMTRHLVIDALTMAYNAVQQGAAGVDMGRNIFQSDAPKPMIAAVGAVVHKNVKPKEAFDMFNSLKANG